MSRKLYQISWVVAIVADSPEDAVRQAVKIQQDKGSYCNSFTVQLIGEPTTDLPEEKDYREVLLRARLIQD